MRGAGLIVAVQGGAALVVAAALRDLQGTDQHIVVSAYRRLGSWSAERCRRRMQAGGWRFLGSGHGTAQLLPVAWYLIVGSHQPATYPGGNHRAWRKAHEKRTKTRCA